MQGRCCRWYGASSGVTAFRHWCVTDDGRCVSRPARMGTYACGEQPNFQQDYVGEGRKEGEKVGRKG